jgi:hypothetical protein
MYDVKEWLKPINPMLHSISSPYIFVIEENMEAAVVLRYKNWSRDTEWKPSNDPNKGIVLLTTVCAWIFFCLFSTWVGIGACNVSRGFKCKSLCMKE